MTPRLPIETDNSKRKPTDFFDLAWAAGFLDGEGTVGVYRRSPRREARHRRPTYFAVAAISNTDREMLEWFKDRFGGAITVLPLQDKFPNAKPAYRWLVNHQNAFAFLRAVAPYVKAKRPQVQLALTFLALVTDVRGRRSEEFYDKQRALYEAHVALGIGYGRQRGVRLQIAEEG